MVELTLLICMMRLQDREKDQFVFEDLLQEYHFLVSGNRKGGSVLATDRLGPSRHEYSISILKMALDHLTKLELCIAREDSLSPVFSSSAVRALCSDPTKNFPSFLARWAHSRVDEPLAASS